MQVGMQFWRPAGCWLLAAGCSAAPSGPFLTRLSCNTPSDVCRVLRPGRTSPCPCPLFAATRCHYSQRSPWPTGGSSDKVCSASREIGPGSWCALIGVVLSKGHPFDIVFARKCSNTMYKRPSSFCWRRLALKCGACLHVVKGVQPCLFCKLKCVSLSLMGKGPCL